MDPGIYLPTMGIYQGIVDVRQMGNGKDGYRDRANEDQSIEGPTGEAMQQANHGRYVGMI